MHLTRKSRLIGAAITVLSSVCRPRLRRLDHHRLGSDTRGQLGPGADHGRRLRDDVATPLSRPTATSSCESQPEPVPVRVTQINGNGTITADTAQRGCTPPVSPTPTDPAHVDVGANAARRNDSDRSGGHVERLHRRLQGATFTIPVALTGASQRPP